MHRWISSIWCPLETSPCAACLLTISRTTLTGTPLSNPVPIWERWCRQNKRVAWKKKRVCMCERERGLVPRYLHAPRREAVWNRALQKSAGVVNMSWKRLLLSWCFRKWKQKQTKKLLWRQSRLLGNVYVIDFVLVQRTKLMFMLNVKPLFPSLSLWHQKLSSVS